MKICKVKECDNKIFAKRFCCRHYMQLRQNGKIYKRTKYDLNEIIKYDDYAEIILYNYKNKEIGRAIIDKDDVEKVKKYRWNLTYRRYVYNFKNNLYLHHLIIGKPAKGYEVDHIFHNTIDNRKSELRFVTHQENMMNRKNAKGYWFNKKNKKMVAEIMVNGKKIFLGRFEKEKDAKKAREEGKKKYFREFAYKN